MEPTCVYFKTGNDGLKQCVRNLDTLLADGGPISRRDARRLRSDMVCTLNTLKGAFALGNCYRTIMVERAKVQAPGSSVGAKKRQQWVEAQLDDNAYAATDIDPTVRALKAEYDHEAGKADLREAARKGGSASGGGYDRREDRDERRELRGGRTGGA